MSEYIEIVKFDIAKLYVDNTKKIFHLDILESHYNDEQFIQTLEYLKNFWILANERNHNYHMMIDIRKIGIYPLTVFGTIKDTLVSLEKIFQKNLNSSCLIFESELAVNILKPLLSMYKAVRPFTFVNTYEEAIIFFNNNKL